jgi:hypothetical protein
VAAPTDPWTWNLCFFIAAGANRDSNGYITSLPLATLPDNLRYTLIEIVTRLKPLHTWCCAMIYFN